MSIARLYIAAFLLIHGLCNAETTGSREIKVNDSDSIERPIVDDAADAPDAAKRREEEKGQQENVEEMLPILPPIILLDFDNGTFEDNVTETDEKSKRTVNNGLGNYGFDRNSLLASRKYNYYFPAGKTGTTVSIEESISPFLPRTIIEKIPPSNQKSISGSFMDFRQQGARGLTGFSYQYYNPMTKSSQVFGLRTKLTKTSDSEPYQGFTSIARPSVDAYSNVNYQDDVYASTTSDSLVFGPADAVTISGYATPSPQSYTASSSSRYTYVTPSPPSYVQRYLGQSSHHTINVQSYSRPKQGAVKFSTSSSLEAPAFLEHLNSHHYARPGSNTVESSTPESDASNYPENAESFPNLPRYTMENGVRYENKIFWKYPDGRVSSTPPKTYETYSEYPSLAALQTAKAQDASQVYETPTTESSVMSQGPVQFPLAPEPTGSRTPFISANSLSRLQQEQQGFRLSYQNFISHQKQAVSQQVKAGSGVSPTYSTTLSPRNSLKSTGKNQKNRYETLRQSAFSKYMVNSPNPEYVNNAEKNTRPTRLFTSSAGGNLGKKINTTGGKNLDGYSNLQYSDLLNYNPSISQYIKNPASILNVQPTFVQAGSSLIPVIILRVDGVPPIQPKATPNVNLKALLQQYLVQYAKSIEELARQSNYDLGDEQSLKDQSSFSTSPLRELARLPLNSDSRDLTGNPTESYIGKSSYEASHLDVEKDLSSRKYGERTAVRPKVKSVQIIEDPNLANHRL